MNYEKFWDDLHAIARLDPEYRYHLEAVRRTEANFIALRNMLTQQQRDALDDYISACEALDDYMGLLAYRLGNKDADPTVPIP